MACINTKSFAAERWRLKFGFLDSPIVSTNLTVYFQQSNSASTYFGSLAFNSRIKFAPKILRMSFLLYPLSNNAFVISG